MNQYHILHQSKKETSPVTNPDQPFVACNYQKGIVYICYCNNLIQVFLRKPFNQSESNVIDITDLPIEEYEGRVKIRNGRRNNHIVGTFNKGKNLVVIHHKKRKYAIPIPPESRRIYCGGNVIYL